MPFAIVPKAVLDIVREGTRVERQNQFVLVLAERIHFRVFAHVNLARILARFFYRHLRNAVVFLVQFGKFRRVLG